MQLWSSEGNIISGGIRGLFFGHTARGVVIGRNNDYLLRRQHSLIGIGGHQAEALDPTAVRRILPLAGHVDILNDTLLN